MAQQPRRRSSVTVTREVAAEDVVDAVVPRELLVEERVVGPQEILHRPILADLALEEELRLLQHRLAQRVVEARERFESGAFDWTLRISSHCSEKSFMKRDDFLSASMR